MVEIEGQKDDTRKDPTEQSDQAMETEDGIAEREQEKLLSKASQLRTDKKDKYGEVPEVRYS